MRNVLVINCGSSSVKYKLISQSSETSLIEGVIAFSSSDIGEHRFTDYRGQPIVVNEPVGAGISISEMGELIHITLQSLALINSVSMIGHRIVHGGEKFKGPSYISPAVLSDLKALNHLAPLHQKNAVELIEFFQQVFQSIPQIGVFDTTFHHSLPEVAYRYAIPEAWFEQYQIRRYGFHGISHQYVVSEAAAFLGKPLSDLNLISIHLGNGASMCAIKNGLSIDTSMGFTPMEGLVMGSRSGDIDVEIVFYLQQIHGYSVENIRHQLEHEAGLKGLAGESDIRKLLAAELRGDERAAFALNCYVYRIRKYIGAYFAVLGRVDALIFTAGVGEHSAEIRQRCCQDLALFGLHIDLIKNRANENVSRLISKETVSPAILVIPTNEEKQIARLAESYCS